MKTASLYREFEFNDNKPAFKVLFETSFTKEIRILLKDGQSMKEHQTSFPIVVEIVDGEIDFGVNRNIHHLKKGELIALDGNVPHDLKAKKDSIIRLTLTKADSTERVENVIND